MSHDESREVPHALVLGGSAMLRGTCLHLAANGWRVGIVSRDERRLALMEQEAAATDGTLHPLPLDYEDLDALVPALERHVEAHEAIRLLVSWVHGGAEAALEASVRIIERKPARQRTLLEVRTASVDGREPPPAASVELGPEWQRRSALIGFRLESDGHQRWLTDDEIAEGLSRAVAEDIDAPLTLGTVGQWSLKA